MGVLEQITRGGSRTQLSGGTGLEFGAHTIHSLGGKVSEYITMNSGCWGMRWCWVIHVPYDSLYSLRPLEAMLSGEI